MLRKHLDEVFTNQCLETTEFDAFVRCVFINCAFHGYGGVFVSCNFFSKDGKEIDFPGHVRLINCSFNKKPS